jgi:hypothetical protein
MKNLVLAVFGLSLPLFAAHAGDTDVDTSPQTCNGQLSVPGGFINGNCNGGNCSAFLNTEYVSGSARCGGGVSAQVSGYAQGGFVSGRCNGGSISLFLPSNRYSLNGSCSNGTRFTGYAESFGGFANGTCQENGSFSIFAGANSLSLSGECR